jgi:hypothetical protein
MPRDLSTRTDPEALGAWLGEPPPDVDDPAALALGMERVYPTLEGRNIDCDWCDEPIYFDGEGRDLRPLYHHAAAGVNVCGRCLDDPATVAELSRPPDLDDAAEQAVMRFVEWTCSACKFRAITKGYFTPSFHYADGDFRANVRCDGTLTKQPYSGPPPRMCYLAGASAPAAPDPDDGASKEAAFHFTLARYFGEDAADVLMAGLHADTLDEQVRELLGEAGIDRTEFGYPSDLGGAR